MYYIAFLILALVSASNTTHAAAPKSRYAQPSPAESISPTSADITASMAGVEIYTIPSCPGCEMAKSTLQSRNIPYKEISLYGRRDLYRQMKERVNAALPVSERRPLDESMTVPKIFINGIYVPNSDLDEALDKTFKANQSQTQQG